MKTSFIFIVVALAALTQQGTACSEQAFRRAVAAAPKNVVSLRCQRAVYNELCGTCGNNVGCYWNMGPKVAPTLSQCRHRRSLRNIGKCSEAGFKQAVALAPKTGASLGCQRAVYNALCEECGTSKSCFWKKGPAIARASPLCRPRETTNFDMEDEDEQVGGRNWGRICATAACLFIDGLNPPPARYSPGNSGPAPIHRTVDMAYGDMEDEDEQVGGRNWGRICATAACLFIDGLNPPPARYSPGNSGPAPIHRTVDMAYGDMEEENVGHYKLPHGNHDPRGWPGHDLHDEGNWKDNLREKWGFLSWGFSNKGSCSEIRFKKGVAEQKSYKPTKVPPKCQRAIFNKCCTKCVSSSCFRNCALEGGSTIVNACS